MTRRPGSADMTWERGRPRRRLLINAGEARFKCNDGDAINRALYSIDAGGDARAPMSSASRSAFTRIKKIYITIALLTPFFFAFIVSGALAQTPNIGGAIEQTAPPPVESPAKPPESPAIAVEEPPENLELSEGETILIKAFRIENSDERDWRPLQNLLVPYRFMEMSMYDITEAANLITVYYRDKGYMLAKAWVPKQDASNGVLTFSVLFGEYGEIRVRNASAIRTSFLRGVFGDVKKRSPIVRRGELERAMLITRDMPGGRMPMVSIASGENPGTSDFVIEIDRSPRFGGYVMANNQGSKYTGEYRTYGGVDINSLLGAADRFSASYMTTDTMNLKNYRFSYDFPLSYDGLRAEASVARTDYELGGAYSVLGMTGSADIVEIKIGYPIRKRPSETIDFAAKAAYKRMRDDITLGGFENPRNSTALTFQVNHEAWSRIGKRGLFTKLSGGFDLGSLNITDIIQEVVDAAGPNTSGFFAKFNLGAAAEIGLAGNLSLGGAARFQKILSGNNVDSTEQFFISGTGGARAFTESVGFDNGFSLNAELKYALPGAGGLRHSANLFVDAGRAWAEKGAYTLLEEYGLSDAGPGYSAGYRRLFGSVHFVIPVGRSEGIDNPGTRVLWQAGISF